MRIRVEIFTENKPLLECKDLYFQKPHSPDKFPIDVLQHDKHNPFVAVLIRKMVKDDTLELCIDCSFDNGSNTDLTSTKS